MGYTYDDFLKAAGDKGLTGKISQEDMAKAQADPNYGLSLVGTMGAQQNAQTPAQAAVAGSATAAMQGYTSPYQQQIQQMMGSMGSGNGFSFDQEQAYKDLLAQVANPQEFSYDYQSDPRWQAYEKMYLREGDRAGADAMARAAAASGGRVSSYAATAGAQAGNYYAEKLADKVPELRAQAYQEYLQGQQQKAQALDALGQDRNFQLNLYGQQYDRDRDMLALLQGQDATAYQRYLDGVARQQAQQQMDFEREKYGYQQQLAQKEMDDAAKAQDQKYADTMIEYYISQGVMPPQDILARSAFDVRYWEQRLKEVQAKQQAKAGATAGNGYSGLTGDDGQTSDDGLTETDDGADNRKAYAKYSQASRGMTTKEAQAMLAEAVSNGHINQNQAQQIMRNLT